jgi:predicted lipid-binding transport protein (Tim44 family)
MIKNWMRRMGTARLMALAVLSIFLGIAVVDTAEARGGRSRGGSFRSFGSRGSRTQDSGQAGRMQPISPSASARNNGLRPNTPAEAARNRGSWFQRNPLLAALGGALAGTILGSLLMNAFGSMGGLGGILMMVLLAMAFFALIAWGRNRKKPAMATGPSSYNHSPSSAPYSAPPVSSGRAFDAPYAGLDNSSAVNTQTREQGLAAIALEDRTMTGEQLHDTLSSRFFQVQEAWSNGDRTVLRAATTETVFDEFDSQLREMERAGERNVIKNIAIRSFEVTEAWQEGDEEYVTALITARLVDYVERGGKVVEGDAVNPTSFNEYWTFVRPRGRGEWKLSAVNQEA